MISLFSFQPFFKIRKSLISRSAFITMLGVGLLSSVGQASYLISTNFSKIKSIQNDQVKKSDIDAMIEAGNYDLTEKKIRSLLSNQKSLALELQLINVYQLNGRYEEALKEGISSSDGLSESDIQNDPISKAIIDNKIDELKKLISQIEDIQKKITTEKDASLLIAYQGDIALIRRNSADSLQFYAKAYGSLPSNPKADEETKYQVEKRYFQSLALRDGGLKASKIYLGSLIGTLNNPQSSIKRKMLVLDILSSWTHQLSETYIALTDRSDPTQRTLPNAITEGQFLVFGKTLAKIARYPQSGDNQELALILRSKRMLFNLAQTWMLWGVDAECQGKLETAIVYYKNANTLMPDTKGGSPVFDYYIKYPSPLIKLLTLQNQASPTSNRYLGVDSTIKENWQNAVGHEAWVLFGAHTSDECGGELIANNLFSYKASISDPKNSVRRWRTPKPKYRRLVVSEPQLHDPFDWDTNIASFLDDNGEHYFRCMGPDVTIDLTIPPGRHILTLPLHISSSFAGSNGHYAFSLLSDVTAAGERQCLAWGIAGSENSPGAVRIAVQGPAKNILIVRRLDSLNANVPAIFLDKDTRSESAPSLGDVFSDAEIKQSLTDQPVDTDFNALVSDYRTASSTLTSTFWSKIATSSVSVAEDQQRSTLRRTIAAYIAWHAIERCPLQSNNVTISFSRYLSLRSRFTAENSDQAKSH